MNSDISMTVVHNLFIYLFNVIKLHSNILPNGKMIVSHEMGRMHGEGGGGTSFA